MNKKLFPSLEGKITIFIVLRLILAIIFSLVAFIFSELVTEIPGVNKTLIRVLITFLFGLIGFSVFPDFAKKTTQVLIHSFNLLIARVSSEIMTQLMRIPQTSNLHVPFSHNAPVGGVSSNKPLILDTSAIIDGRIMDIAKSGFITGVILIPTFILTELQQVADSSDYLKRTRARRGFEIIEEIKKIKGLRVDVWEKEPVAKTVDEKLIKLAKNLHGRIVTTDFNLNRVASVSNVSVLNINDLANAVKTAAIPGDKLEVKVIHIGKDPKQGVGYLADGTMIVIEEGADLVGKEIKTEVTRLLQVPAGKMIFAKKV